MSVRVRLRDLEELSPNRFQPGASTMSVHCGTPAYKDREHDVIHVEEEFYLVGWCGKMHERFMHNREGQIGLLLFHPDFGEVWQHYPLYTEEARDGAVFETSKLLETE